MRILRLSGAVLLVAEVLLMIHPMLLASNFFSGAGMLGKGLFYVRVPDVIAQG